MAEPGNGRLQRIAYHLLTFGNPRARNRLRREGVDAAAFLRLPESRLAAAGFSRQEIQAMARAPLARAESEASRAARSGIEIVFSEEEDFPSPLRQIFDPPDFLYLAGDRGLLRREKLAVVGSRRGSAYGQRVLQRLLPDLCRAGLVIVSGMAYGIDSMAHAVTLAAGGGTIGVNPGGLLHLYPTGNRGLLEKIRRQGAVLSEFPLDTVPRPHLFPVRNRIIAGLARAVLVVEATQKSGSLITARLALEQNREVMAVPGDIHSALCSGTNSLIQAGAKAVCSSRDVLDEYGLRPRQAEAELPALSPREKRVLDLLSANGVKDIDSLVEELNISPAELLSVLMGLVLKNLITEESGAYRRIVNG